MVAAAMLATGCTQDDTFTAAGDGSAVITPDPDKGIIISGSGANGIGATRGYVDPDGNNYTDSGKLPQEDGICRADAIEIWLFKHGMTGLEWPSSAESLTFKENELFKITDADIKILGNDRYASFTHNIMYESEAAVRNNYTYVSAKAFAYSEADKSLFTTNLIDKNITNASISINNIDGKRKTPELFYGIVRGEGENVSPARNSNNCPDWLHDGFFWSFYRSSDNDDVSDETRDVTFTGRIFRIVGQLNLNITEIPGEAVEKIELWGDKRPRRVLPRGLG